MRFTSELILLLPSLAIAAPQLGGIDLPSIGLPLPSEICYVTTVCSAVSASSTASAPIKTSSLFDTTTLRNDTTTSSATESFTVLPINVTTTSSSLPLNATSSGGQVTFSSITSSFFPNSTVSSDFVSPTVTTSSGLWNTSSAITSETITDSIIISEITSTATVTEVSTSTETTETFTSTESTESSTTVSSTETSSETSSTESSTTTTSSYILPGSSTTSQFSTSTRTTSSGSAGPTAIEIRGVTYGGSGCGANTVNSQLSKDKSMLTLLYGAFVAQTGPGLVPTDARKNCQLNIAMTYPGGWQFSIFKADYRGYANLPAGQKGVVRASYYFSGQSEQVSVKQSSLWIY